MNHPIFGDLRYGIDDQQWSGLATLTKFAAFGDAMYQDEDEQPRRRAGILPLAISDPTGAGPSPQQEAAFRFLRDNEADVFRAALNALFVSYKEYTASLLSGFWGWVGGLLGVKPIESPEALAAEASFSGVQVAREHQQGLAYILFDVNCGWEPEHGMMVVWHKGRPTTWTTIEALELESDG